jgi:8-oxo-dGTP pyrophosphatase MutT (NUDIX family)
VLSPNKAEVLLIFHGKLHRWLQPGGHVDPEDPDILEAAKREVAEEVGIDGAGLDLLADGIFDIDVHEIPARKQDPKHSHFDVRFLFRAHSLQMCAGSDAKDARWVPLDQIDGVEQDASVMRAVQKIRQRLPFAVSTG